MLILQIGHRPLKPFARDGKDQLRRHDQRLLIDGENRIESGNRVEARGWHKGDDDARDEVVEQVALAIEQETQATRSWIDVVRSEEHTSELQSLMRISYAVFCLKKKKTEKARN